MTSYSPDFEIVPPAWQRRESERFNSCEYQRAPWETHNYNAQTDCAEWRPEFISADAWAAHPARLHYAHASTDAPEMLAYTMNSEKGERDIQTRIKPGKYLRKYFGDILDAQQIETYSQAWAARFAIPEVSFAHTSNEIEQVYSGGPRSCMAGEDPCDLGYNPTRVYGAGDLAIAYLGEIGHATARALCWPERKLYGRVYGDDKLTSALDALGYSEGPLFGARLLKIRAGNGYAMPYLDGASAGEHSDGEHFVIAQRGHSTSTGGTILNEPEYPCEYCREDAGDDYMSAGDSILCESCYSDHFSYCDTCSESYRNEDFRTVRDERGRETYMCDNCAETHPECSDCGEHCVSEFLAGEIDGDPLCQRCAERGDYANCENCSEIKKCADIKQIEFENRTENLCDDCAPEHSERECCGEIWANGETCACENPAREKWPVSETLAQACAVTPWAPLPPAHGIVYLKSYGSEDRNAWPALLYGPLAVHPERQESGSAGKSWKVTHSVSGLAISGGFDSPAAAHAMARAMQYLPQWGEIGPDATMASETRDYLRDSINAFRRQVEGN